MFVFVLLLVLSPFLLLIFSFLDGRRVADLGFICCRSAKQLATGKPLSQWLGSLGGLKWATRVLLHQMCFQKVIANLCRCCRCIFDTTRFLAMALIHTSSRSLLHVYLPDVTHLVWYVLLNLCTRHSDLVSFVSLAVSVADFKGPYMYVSLETEEWETSVVYHSTSPQWNQKHDFLVAWFKLVMNQRLCTQLGFPGFSLCSGMCLYLVRSSTSARRLKSRSLTAIRSSRGTCLGITTTGTSWCMLSEAKMIPPCECIAVQTTRPVQPI